MQDPTTNSTSYTMTINGTFVDGSTFPDGDYKVLLRALKVTGNQDLLEDHELWLSPMHFIVNRNSSASP